MIQRTSLEVYHRIKSEGLLSQLRFEVYEILFRHGPLTAGEVWSRYFRERRQRSSISARMSELERRGAIVVHEARACGYTGNTSIAWRTTNNIPSEIDTETKIKCDHCNGKGYIKPTVKFDEKGQGVFL